MAAKILANNSGKIGTRAKAATKAIAEAIGKGHAWEDHYEDRARSGIETKGELSEFIVGMMRRASGKRHAGPKRWTHSILGCQNENTGHHNPGGRDLGTAFQPDKGINYFKGLN